MTTYADPGYQSDKKPRYPVDDAAHVRAAWSFINEEANAAAYSAEDLAKVKDNIKAAAKKFGVTIADDSSRSAVETEQMAVRRGSMITRSYALDDIKIMAGGDGRTVEAYAAVFGQEAEIRDHEGHYVEVNDPGAFDKVIARAQVEGWRVGVFYNHGMTIHGTPSESASVPLGAPEKIVADSRGLLTVTRYNKTAQADDILEAIKSGSITAQSYTGPMRASTPSLSRSQRRMGGYLPKSDGSLQLVRRMELGLVEYGPTPIPAYQGAAIVGVRSMLYNEGPDEDQTPDVSEESAPVELDPLAVRQARLQRRIRAALLARERAPQ